MTNGEIGVGYAKELTIQLITLSTGLVGLSVTFGKDVLGGIGNSRTGLLKAAWVMLLVSIVFGITTLMALTGTLLEGGADTVVPPLPAHELNFARTQIVTFMLGTIFLVVFYGRRIGRKAPQAEYKVLEISSDKDGVALGNLTTEGWTVVSLAVRNEGQWSVVLRK